MSVTQGNNLFVAIAFLITSKTPCLHDMGLKNNEVLEQSSYRSFSGLSPDAIKTIGVWRWVKTKGDSANTDLIGQASNKIYTQTTDYGHPMKA